MKKFSSRVVGYLILIIGFVVAGESFAETESPVACIEGSEPTALAYGDHTTGCIISPTIDNDTFLFSGVINDHVRINVMSTTTNMDPFLEVRDSGGTVIASGSCSQGGCTFSLELLLPASGNYLLTLSDAGNNEAGGYVLQLERILPAPRLQRLDYDNAVSDIISPQTDIDHYYFNATAGTSLRLHGFSTTTNMDPTIELRDPNGTLVLNGAADGAGCANGSCTFSIDIIPVFTGEYSLIVYDAGTNEVGGYQLSLWCIIGPCDSDGDGIPDPASPQLSYDAPVSDTITPQLDADFFTFNATAGTSIRLHGFSTTTNMDPTIELRDPNNTLVLNGAADGAGCDNGSCTFSVDIVPAFTGEYSLIVYDAGTNEVGGYQLSLWCIIGPCDSDGDGVPDADPPVLSYVNPVSDTITPQLDADFFNFNATAGTSIRLHGFSTTTNMDPTIELRDPNNTLVLDGAADGAGCENGSCTFSVDIVPAFTGEYSLILYDAGTNEVGGYQLSLWCILGNCDSDGDGVIDNDREIINYGDTIIKDINPQVDGDFYLFNGTAGDQIRLNAFSATTNMDPTIEVYDPDGVRVLNGVADGASCNNGGCTFSVDFIPVITGTYLVVLYDLGTNEIGRYHFGLQCVFSPGDFVCDDLTSAPICDNCSIVANPDQRDTDADGYGNICDADLDNNGVVQAGDLAIMKERFFTRDPDADLDGNGIVQAGDLAIMKKMFFQPPGPSCVAPNAP